ncbi:MAG TPA: PQQ-binding-like beta-propeller repeat protein, partial [Planctomycetia bacterium]|nr:PQQ-binding-like beta-propeller repeat protein [Planctomycetia bacterium]
MLGIWACVALLAGADDNWPEFRAFHGVSKATNTPVTFGESENVKWKTPIPGKAWASPVIWGDRIWLANAPVDGKELHVLGVDRESGKIVQDFKVFDIPFPEFCHATNSHASCTPTVEEGRIYAHFGSNGTAALDMKTGAKLWERRDLPCNHFRGPASSPILVGDRLYVQFDGFDFQYVVCLDKNTGKTIWKKDRDTEYGEIDGDRKKAYGTPSLIEHAGRKMLVTSAAFETIAFNPDNGDFLWRVKHGGMNGAARPIYAHGLIYLCAGQDDRTLVAVKPDGTGDISSQIVWSTGKNVPLRGSPLLVGDLLFM